MSQELRLLQAARLKGRPTPDDLATSTALPPDELSALTGELLGQGLLVTAGARLRLTPEGKVRLDELVRSERDDIDQAALTEAYEDFDGLNREFKQLMTDWQLIDGTRPNDHTDAAYDAGIVQRLGEIDEACDPLLTRLVEIAPRLEPYPQRFAAAIEKVRAGDHSWFARPLADSYHTVWFELHEDLIGLAGLSRAEEAVAGRAE